MGWLESTKIALRKYRAEVFGAPFCIVAVASVVTAIVLVITH